MQTPQTPAKNLAAALGLSVELYLKREDLHPYGSHKGRSIPIMIERHQKEGWESFCLSSSGNAALAAVYTVEELNKNNPTLPIKLYIFVGKHIDPKKLERLQQTTGSDTNIKIEMVDAPKQAAFQMDKDFKAKNLRQSTDDTALLGYETLADELGEIENLSAVFIPTSSGTTAQALYQEFLTLDSIPQIHIVQTPACHPIVKNTEPAGPSMATAIVDKVAYRKEAVLEAIQKTKGNGWIATDAHIAEIKKLVKETENVDISSNSALSVAGLKLAIQKNWQFDGPVACLITGE